MLNIKAKGSGPDRNGTGPRSIEFSIEFSQEVWQQFLSFLPMLVKVADTPFGIMATINSLQGNAFGHTIRVAAKEYLGRRLSAATLYACLQALEDRGLISHEDVEVDVVHRPKGGKRLRRRYFLTSLGRLTYAAHWEKKKEPTTGLAVDGCVTSNRETSK